MPAFDSPYVYHAWLASAQIQPDIVRQVLDTFGTPEAFYTAFLHGEPAARESVSGNDCSKLLLNAEEHVMVQFDRSINEHRIRAFTIRDSIYPDLLRQIPDPPAVLFYQGNPECFRLRTLTIVGSRAASYSGRRAAENLAKELSRHGIPVVSGFACGIDAAAHRGCMDGGSPTIAVTGCGLDIVYPSGHTELRNEILRSGGLVLSEYAPGEKPCGWHFPVRNRILTGLSIALILIEARIRSGSLTSVQHALDQGRDVFVYPGDPESAYFEGNHRLLREGALYFTCADDILEDLGWLDNQPIVRQNIDCSSLPSFASKAEESVIQALQPGALGFEQLAEISRLSPAELMSTLTILQVKGIIESLPGKTYQLKR